MNKTFTIKPYKTFQFYLSFIPLIIFILCVVDAFQNKKEIKFLLFAGMVFFFIFFAYFIVWACSILVKVDVNDENLVIKSPIFKTKIEWNNIQEIKYQWVGYAGYALGIKEQKKTHWMPDTFEDFNGLIRILQNKTGKKVIGYK